MLAFLATIDSVLNIGQGFVLRIWESFTLRVFLGFRVGACIGFLFGHRRNGHRNFLVVVEYTVVCVLV